MKKYAIDRLYIEVGRWCNMTCEHCLKGEREKLAIKPEYIDKFLDNIYFVNHLYFCGGESVFYINEMKEILEIFKKKNILINYVRVHSNILIKSEKFISFLNEIGQYSKHPEEVKLMISKDKFHLKNMEDMGISYKQYEETKQWYRNRLTNNIILRENSDPEWRLLLEGKAKNLPKDKLKNYRISEINYMAYKNTLVFPETITNEDKGNTMENALSEIAVSSEGYIYTTFDLSYEMERYNNYELSLGYVGCDTLENMMNKWNDKITIPNKEQIKVVLNDGISTYIKKTLGLEDKIREAVYSGDEKSLLKIKNEAEQMLEDYKKDLNYDIENKEYQIRNSMIVASFMSISTILKMTNILLDIPNGFFRKLGMKVIDSQKEKGKYENAK